MRLAGDFIATMVDQSVAEGDARRTVERIGRFWKKALTSTDYRAGCPVVAMAVDSREHLPDAAELVREIFARWQASLSELLSANGFPAQRARRLATLIVSSIEGAIILCRAQGDLKPLDDVLAELTPLLGER